jgi:beta-lactamase class D
MQEIFKKHGFEGCFVLYDKNLDEITTWNYKRAQKGFLPASTFKIVNSLIALQTGVAKDAQLSIPWDGIQRAVSDWNQDQTMETAFKVSCVPYYQEIARRIGFLNMKKWVDTIPYGHMDITRKNLDTFWLEGNSQITPLQQLDFIRRLYDNKLPFNHENIDIVKQLMINEKNESYTLRAKTGWAIMPDGNDVGWFVGYLEQGGNVHFFVCNIQGNSTNMQAFPGARKAITTDILNAAGLMEASLNKD